MGVYIDIALSLVFIYLVLSLVVSAVNELVAMWVRQRPAMLAKSILSLIDDDELWKGFYKAGSLINPRLAAKGESQADWSKPAPAAADKPAKNEAITNSKALFKAGLDWRWWKFVFPTRSQTEGHASFIDGVTFARALTTSVLRRYGNGQLPSSYAFGDVERAVTALALLPDSENSQIRDVLVSAIANAKNDLEAFEKQLGAWFDRAQDRVSGEYTRWAKVVTLIIGALLVGAMNVDTVRIAHELKRDSDARTALAESIVKAYAPNSGSVIHANCEPSGVEPRKELTKEQQAKKQACLTEVIARTQDVLDEFGPNLVGWGNDPLWQPGPAVSLERAGNAFNKLLGLLVTICAISLGAPFWFDMLSKVVNIRAAGVKPKDEAGKA